MFSTFFNKIGISKPKTVIFELEKNSINEKNKLTDEYEYEKQVMELKLRISEWLNENTSKIENERLYTYNEEAINKELLSIGLKSDAPVMLIRADDFTRLKIYLKENLESSGVLKFYKENLDEYLSMKDSYLGVFFASLNIIMINLDKLNSSKYNSDKRIDYLTELVFHEKIHSTGSVNYFYNDNEKISTREGNFGVLASRLEEGYVQMMSKNFNETLRRDNLFNYDVVYLEGVIIKDPLLSDLLKSPGLIYENLNQEFEVPLYFMQGVIFSKIAEMLGDGFLELINILRSRVTFSVKKNIYNLMVAEMNTYKIDHQQKQIGLHDYINEVYPAIKNAEQIIQFYNELDKISKKSIKFKVEYK